KHELTQEPAVGLAPEQRRVITSTAAPQRVRPMFRWAAVAASVAAGLLIVATLSVPPQHSREATPVPLTAIAPVSEAQPAESDRYYRRNTETAIGIREKVESASKESQAPPPQQGGQSLQQGQQGQQAPRAQAGLLGASDGTLGRLERSNPYDHLN